MSEYLAAAPPSIRGWAHAQVAALDQAYLQLTDPVGLEGSALRSPTRPPTVVPGGPATPPARRGPAPAVRPIPDGILADVDADAQPAWTGGETSAESVGAAGVASAADEADLDDLAVLYASVTPSAHPDMLPAAKSMATATVAVPAPRAVARRAAAPTISSDPQAANPWKRLVLAGVAVIAIAGVGFGAMQVVGAIGGSPTPSSGAAATQGAPAVDLGEDLRPDGEARGRSQGHGDASRPGERVLRGRAVRGGRRLARQAPRHRPRAHRRPACPRRRQLQHGRCCGRQGHLAQGRGAAAGERRGALRPRLPLPEPDHPGLGRRPARVGEGHRARPDVGPGEDGQVPPRFAGGVLHDPRSPLGRERLPRPDRGPGGAPAAAPRRPSAAPSASTTP